MIFDMGDVPDGCIEVLVRDHEFAYRHIQRVTVPDPSSECDPLADHGGTPAGLMAFLREFHHRDGVVGASYRRWKSESGT